MKKILTDAAAVGQAAGRVLNWRSDGAHPGLGLLRRIRLGQHAVGGRRLLRNAAAGVTRTALFKPLPPTGARTLDSRTAFYYGYTLD